MVYTAVALRTLRTADVTRPPRGGGSRERDSLRAGAIDAARFQPPPRHPTAPRATGSLGHRRFMESRAVRVHSGHRTPINRVYVINTFSPDQLPVLGVTPLPVSPPDARSSTKPASLTRGSPPSSRDSVTGCENKRNRKFQTENSSKKSAEFPMRIAARADMHFKETERGM